MLERLALSAYRSKPGFSGTSLESTSNSGVSRHQLFLVKVSLFYYNTAVCGTI